jgi:N-acetylglucosaminyl-diphospho-decaprenol L-rhamnosyltransferase
MTHTATLHRGNRDASTKRSPDGCASKTRSDERCAVTVVIINHNTRTHLYQCLTSVIASGHNGPIVVVDNASTDGSAEMVRACFPQVDLVVYPTNLGYGAAANLVIAGCQTDYVLLLNSDTVLAAGVVHALQGYLDQHRQVAIVGPRLHNPDGTLQASCYPSPTPFQLFLQESLMGRLVGHVPGLRAHYLRTWAHDEVRAVPWVLGAALAIRRAAFVEIGGFDAAFTMYFEETDLCHRLWHASPARAWEVHFAPVGVVIHVGGASTSRYYAKMQAQLFESMQLFYARHFSRSQALRLRVLMLPVVAARLVQDAARYARARNDQARTRFAEILRVRGGMLRRCLFSSHWAAR